ncbi:SDR family NAD(P)-dependent oxidoreductase [Nocardioides sediminis]|uniref:SDR family NAD(P)-dependent oxidoreductase n=1 Tax=Nocardioides sediminis TaxID=433648 RepID=UPI000D320AC6|nr:SDR family NAD(P)-dependent oxidoreductase [Nocardioides sediminis]
MDLTSASAIVTGGASGLGRATAARLVEAGARVVILDLPSSAGASVAEELGDHATFAPGDVTVAADVAAAVETAAALGPLRALVHCAGRGATVRVLDREGRPGDAGAFEEVVRLNLVGTYTVLSHAASAMVQNEPVDGERGACILTASVAAWEGQIGQTPYAASKAGIVGMTLVAARDLAAKQVRVCSIAPGIFDTPILDRLGDDLKAKLAAGVPHPARLGEPDEFARLALAIIDNSMLNGETIRLDGAIRMAPR